MSAFCSFGVDLLGGAAPSSSAAYAPSSPPRRALPARRSPAALRAHHAVHHPLPCSPIPRRGAGCPARSRRACCSARPPHAALLPRRSPCCSPTIASARPAAVLLTHHRLCSPGRRALPFSPDARRRALLARLALPCSPRLAETSVGGLDRAHDGVPRRWP
ncbi:hypothetical protein D1007_35882 [Hordeum vulgare]|nr:hypothetical protein D1007_35882 [Hordeum vulgare]